MSRNKVSIWIENLLFFVLFSGYYFGIIFVAWRVVPQGSQALQEPLNATDLIGLVMSMMFGVMLSLWGIYRSLISLVVAFESGRVGLMCFCIRDVMLYASMVLVPLFAIQHQVIIQHLMTPNLAHGIIGLFILGIAFHCFRAKNTNLRLSGESSCAR